MTTAGFTSAAAAVLTSLAASVPFPMWVVSRKSGDDYVVLAAHDRQYGILQGDVLPWNATLCARMIDGSAPCATGDIAQVPAFLEAAAELRMDIGAYITVPVRGANGELFGTLCGADPQRHEGALEGELAQAHNAAQVLAVILEQQLRLEQALRRSENWEHAATLDALTGVGNRRMWDEMLLAVEEQCATLGSRAVVVVLDLDGLKTLNDQLGHAAGDTLLRATGEVLRSQLRRDDVVARTGGDEFGILLVETDVAHGYETAERIRAALAAVDIEVSVGVCARTPGTTLERTWQLADAAMYSDKRSRKGCPPKVPAGRRTPLPVRGAQEAKDLDDTIRALLHDAREALGMPVAFVSRFTEGRRVVEAVDGACPVPISPGDSHAAEDTYCQRIVDGGLPQVIPDTAQNAVTAGLPVTHELGIGSYVGVPILLPDASVYGTLCAYADTARPVDERDGALLQLVARTIGLQLSGRLESWQHEAHLRERVREVVEGDLLTAVYQPIVDLGSGSAVALEALSRFPQSYGRRPDQWFADAAEVGEGAALEVAAARTAAQALEHLPPDVALTVNVSAAVAVTPEFLDWLSASPVERLVLELTEHEQIDDYEALNLALQPARDAGLRLAVDDAGAGYASMRHMLLVKPDLLKLDISLVRDVDVDRDKRALCAAVITFAHETGARVIAEGVETTAELRTVRLLGADYVQGYVLQHPASLGDVRLHGYATSPVPSDADAAAAEATMQTILEMKRAGHSSASIAARLNRLGELRPGGRRWHASAVARVVTPRLPAPR